MISNECQVVSFVGMVLRVIVQLPLDCLGLGKGSVIMFKAQKPRDRSRFPDHISNIDYRPLPSPKQTSIGVSAKVS